MKIPICGVYLREDLLDVFFVPFKLNFINNIYYFFTVFFFLGIGRLRVGENSPRRWPSLSCVTSIGNHRVPL